ncbi:MAG: hypothetical protein ACLS9T_02300 [Streptococcus salivarius]
MSTKLKELNSKWDIVKANSEARKIRDKSWNTLEEKLSIIGGRKP